MKMTVHGKYMSAIILLVFGNFSNYFIFAILLFSSSRTIDLQIEFIYTTCTEFDILVLCLHFIHNEKKRLHHTVIIHKYRIKARHEISDNILCVYAE